MQRDISMIGGRVYKLGNFWKEQLLYFHEWISEDKKSTSRRFSAHC